MSAYRYAIYFIPPAESPLASFGARILGYDVERASSVERAALSGVENGELEAMTAEPVRYGFHATLKAPFRLNPPTSAEALFATADALAAERRPASLGHLSVEPLGAFVALRPIGSVEAVEELASDCVRAFDSLRAPPDERERRRRLTNGLTERQAGYVERWGYPYVFDEFRFHMTLTGPIPEPRRAAWLDALREAFRPLAAAEAVIDSICIAAQETPESRFRVVHRAPLKE